MGILIDRLSPRVRGNRPTDLSSISPATSIPACAGEPLYHLDLL